MKILVVEDDALSNRMLTRILESWGHEVVSRQDGIEALEALESDAEVALMVTDWMMPRLDGIELCRRVREMDRRRYLHVIMLTARGAKDDLLMEAIEAGADAFLAKPLNPMELRAQLRVVRRILDQEEMLLDAQAHMKANLEAAARIQRSLLPQSPPKVPGLEVAWVFDSCDEVAGDMFNVVRLDDRHVGLYILDVSGHGVPAALLAVSVSRALTPFPEQGGLLRRRLDDGTYEIVAPVEVAQELNRRFPVMMEAGQFFSFEYGVLDLETREFAYTSAGHPMPVVSAGEGARVCDGKSSRVVGIWPRLDCQEHRVPLEPGDLLLMYTDGAFEAIDATNEEFGFERMLEVVHGRRHEGITSVVDGLRGSVLSFSGEIPRRDDITILGLGLAPLPASLPTVRERSGEVAVSPER